jgi:DNA-binding response OmpR family regulator
MAAGRAGVAGDGLAATLLIADDETDEYLLRALADRGIEVTVVGDGARALLEIGRLAPAAVLVSARLPVLDGATVVRTLRTVRSGDEMPILFAVGPDDRRQAAEGLDAGATACVGKPYRVNEVLALVGSMGGAEARRAGSDVPEPLRVGAVSLDVAAHEVRVRGEPVRLPPREFRLLQVLLENAGRVVARETLLNRVWGTPATDTNTLAVHVRRLRRRLGDSAAEPTLIESIRGVGYRFRLPVGNSPGLP